MKGSSHIRNWIVAFVVTATLVAVGYWQWPPRRSYIEHKGAFPAAYFKLENQSAWCDSFLTDKGRLPTPEELQARFGQVSWIYAEQPEWSKSWGASGRAYILTSTVGEWNLFLQSWDGGRFEIYNEW